MKCWNCEIEGVPVSAENLARYFSEEKAFTPLYRWYDDDAICSECLEELSPEAGEWIE